jgi:type I restriction enzyme S subunit
MISGVFPVVASTTIKGYHNQPKIKSPCVVTGRSGSLGIVQYITKDCWPLNTSLYVKDFKGNFPKYVYYYLKTMHLEIYNSGAGVPTLNQNHLHSLRIKVHKLEIQQKIADILSAYDDLIEPFKILLGIKKKS